MLAIQVFQVQQHPGSNLCFHYHSQMLWCYFKIIYTILFYCFWKSYKIVHFRRFILIWTSSFRFMYHYQTSKEAFLTLLLFHFIPRFKGCYIAQCWSNKGFSNELQYSPFQPRTFFSNLASKSKHHAFSTIVLLAPSKTLFCFGVYALVPWWIMRHNTRTFILLATVISDKQGVLFTSSIHSLFAVICALAPLFILFVNTCSMLYSRSCQLPSVLFNLCFLLFAANAAPLESIFLLDPFDLLPILLNQ